MVELIFSPSNSMLGNWLVSLPCVWCLTPRPSQAGAARSPNHLCPGALLAHLCSCEHSTLLQAEPHLCL